MTEVTPVEKIGLDVPIQEVYPSFVERYFTPRYALDVCAKGEDICVLFHSNRVSLITLAPSHPVLTQGLRVLKVDFEASESGGGHVSNKFKRKNDKTNRLKNKVTGKRKRGAQELHRRSLLCNVELEDGSVYPIRSGVSGLLLEINEELIGNPNLIRERPSAEGYIAVLLHRKVEYETFLNRMLTQEQYEELKDRRSYQEPNQDTPAVLQDKDFAEDIVISEQNGKASAAEDGMGGGDS